MRNLTAQITNLSPEKRALLESLLEEEGIDLSRSLIVPQSRTSNAFPLSFAQQRLWFLDQLEPDSPLYNIPSALRLTGSLDVTLLRRSLNEVVRRHEALRTTFDQLNGQPRQIIAPELTIPLPVIDLTELPEAEREEEAQRLVTQEAQRPFDLEDGPLLRARLLHLSSRDHILLFTMHHIISDGWSMGVLVREVATLYAALSQGRPASLPDLPIQYVDFAAWQRQWLQGEPLEEQLGYWEEQLDGAPPVLELPTDCPRPAVPSSRGDHLTFHLPRSLTEQLKALGQQEEATLFMTLLAAFQTLLYRYSHQTDISIGTPIANRQRAEIEHLIGFFVNTLVIRTDLSGEPSFRELLGRVRETTLEAYEHQDLPFEMLVEKLQPERNLSHTPLLQVMFALQNAPVQAIELPGLTLAPVEATRGTAIFDITLSMAEEPDGLSGAIEYNTDIFDRATIQRMVSHFRVLLTEIVDDPDRPIGTFPLLTKAERHQILVDWNETTASYPHDRCLHHLFEAQVARTPEAVAAISEGEQLTYQALNRRANQVAHYVRSLGVRPGALVGIYTDRSLDIIVAILGILKAGAAYVPFDPNYPSERLAFMLEDTHVSVILTQKGLADTLPAHEAHTVCLDAAQVPFARESDENPAVEATPHDYAYVFYTSGSTGRPKGVCCHHRGVVNLLDDFQRRQPITLEEHCSWWTSPNFDVSVYEIFSPLLYGGTLYIVPEYIRPDAVAFAKWMAKHAIESAYIPPFMLTSFSAWLNASTTPPPLKRLLVGVEPIPEPLLADINASIPDLHIINGYGPTETTICSTLYPVHPEEAQDQNTPIGKPVQNSQIYLLDATMQPVPVGTTGEVYIGGDGVSHGYLRRPKMTAERFVPDHFSGEPGARLYRTGDLARHLPDGNIMFAGRVDFQVKVRGFRIELGEIQKTLKQHPGARDAVVVVREDTPGDKRIVGYVIPEDPVPSTSDLRGFLKEKLPEYMVPSAFVFLDAFPLSPNGKINRRALPAPEVDRADLAAAYVAPRTPTEELLASIWGQVLDIERVGVHDNFFELGGHSLLATQLLSRVQDAFQVNVPIRALFERPTIASLAEAVDDAQRETAGVQAPPIRPLLRDAATGLPTEPPPLSFAQQRLWFLDKLEPESPLYNIPEAVRIEGPLDIEALRRSLNEIIRRHEVLRTTFPTEDGQPGLSIAPTVTLPLPVVDLTALPEAERETEALLRARQEARRPFDLAHGPLVRAKLLQLGPEDHIILLTMHHIVSDGWSNNLLIRELAALYEAFSDGRRSPLPELPIQYADFAAWQRAWLQGEALETQLDYWKEQLADLPPRLTLPTDHPRPALQSARGGYYVFHLPADLAEQVKNLSREENGTLFMTLLAAFQVLLARYSGQQDISVGTPIANRTRSEIEDLIGFFVNTLVLRTDLSGEPSFRDLLTRVRNAALEAYAHQDLPFEKLVDALQPERDTSHTPLFQVMFVFQNALTQTPELPNVTLSPLEMETGVAMFDLTLVMEESAEGLAGAVEYNADLFDAATIRRMTGHFQTLLEGIVADPDRPISDIPLLTRGEKQRVLLDWNDTAAPYPQDRYLHQLFEAQAARTPDATALIFPSTGPGQGQDKRLTYAELNRRANQLAHHLQKLGVEPETLVGLCVDRSPAMIVGLLGILKAGGAYLPLDPSYPEERLAFMMEDAEVPVLLTQAPLIDRLNGKRKTEYGKEDPQHPQRTVICLDTDWSRIAQEPADNPESPVKPENAAYVIYTSGSTGQPKGVLVSHRSVVNHNAAVAELFDLAPSDRVLQFSTINFDAAVEEIFPTWLKGATVVLRVDDMLTTGEQLLQLVTQQEITVLDLPTAYWHEWVYELSLLDEPLPESLRLVVVGGEKASAERLATWQRIAADGPTWMNTYGPTEGTIIATFYTAPTDARWDVTTDIPIGRPIANGQIYLLDANLQPVPVGVPGELHIGGMPVARGYLNRPRLTAANFTPDPFSREPGARLYKTGDVARYLPDGNIEFVGRVDDQVKVRGFRVEPGEIEMALNQLPDLRDAVVLTQDDETGPARLIAYVVPDGKPPTVDKLRGFLSDNLPDYMMPSLFVTLDALPMTPSGKVDRRALPAPEPERPDLEAAYVAPRTPKEEILAEIWEQVLGLDRVGVHDNFFQLGGDSILSIQVIARANQAGLRLTPRQIFEAPTVAQLALAAGAGLVVQAEQGLVEGPIPLTPIQRWFFEQDLMEPHHWNQAVMLEVEQALEPDLLETTITRLLEHHDALRLRFERVSEAASQRVGESANQRVGESANQRVGESANRRVGESANRRISEPGWRQINVGVNEDAPFERFDLSNLSNPEQKAALEARASALQASLDLTAEPLMRVAYFDLGPEQPDRLLMVVHHLAIDGVSWRILLEDFQTAYEQLRRGETVQLPPKTTSFQRWARRLSTHAQSEAVQAELPHWLSIAESETLAVPVDFPEGANTEASAQSVAVSLSVEETEALLKEVPAAYRVEINDALLTALAQAMSRWTSAPTTLIELEGHGREDLWEDIDVSRTVGWFTTIYPVALQLTRSAGPGEALMAVKEQLRQIPNRGLGYGLLRYLSQDAEIVRQLRALPHPEVSFNYLGQFDQALDASSPFRLAEEAIGPDRSPKELRSHLLDINGSIIQGRLRLEWTYSENLHRRATIQRVSQDFAQALRALIAHCRSGEAGGVTPSDFKLADLSQRELDKVLAKINRK